MITKSEKNNLNVGDKVFAVIFCKSCYEVVEAKIHSVTIFKIKADISVNYFITPGGNIIDFGKNGDNLFLNKADAVLNAISKNIEKAQPFLNGVTKLSKYLEQDA